MKNNKRVIGIWIWILLVLISSVSAINYYGYGYKWEQVTPYTGSVHSVAVSSDGKIQTIAAASEGFYVSNNYGETWKKISSKASWIDVVMSNNGEYQTAIVGVDSSSNDQNYWIYRSSDYGDTWWPLKTEPMNNWIKAAISGTGKYQIIVTYNEKIYLSSNYGVNWQPKLSDKSWRSAAISDDGKYQAVLAVGSGIYLSEDFGNTWLEKPVRKKWQEIAMSNNGQYRTAVGEGIIYISSDYGNTWRLVKEPTYLRIYSSGETSEKKVNLLSIAMSGDGMIQTAVAKENRIYVSFDYGETWTERRFYSTAYDVDMSDDGKIQLIGSRKGFLSNFFNCNCEGTSCQPGNTGKKCDQCDWIDVSSVTEECDGIDNDCDGFFDEKPECPSSMDFSETKLISNDVGSADLAISEDHLFLFYESNGKSYYKKNFGTEELIDNQGGFSKIDVDSSNTPHFAWTSNDGKNLYYKHYDRTKKTLDTDSSGRASTGSVSVDKDNNVHVFYSIGSYYSVGGYWQHRGYHKVYSDSGSELSSGRFDLPKSGHTFDSDTDSKADIYTIGNTPIFHDNNLHYKRGTDYGATWDIHIGLNKKAFSGSLKVDSNDKMHFVYAREGQSPVNLRYEKGEIEFSDFTGSDRINIRRSKTIADYPGYIIIGSIAIDVDDQGNRFVIWVEDPNGENGGNARLMSRTYYAEEDIWCKAKVLAEDLGNSIEYSSNIVIDSGGNHHIIYGKGDDLYYMKGVCIGPNCVKDSCEGACTPLSSSNFGSDVVAGQTLIKAQHINDLCTSLRETESQLGLTQTTCTVSANNLIKVSDFTKIWDGIETVYNNIDLTINWGSGVQKPQANGLIRAVHMNKMRSELNRARTNLC